MIAYKSEMSFLKNIPTTRTQNHKPHKCQTCRDSVIYIIPYICHFCCKHCWGIQDTACSLNQNDFPDSISSMCRCTEICVILHPAFETTILPCPAQVLQQVIGTAKHNILLK